MTNFKSKIELWVTHGYFEVQDKYKLNIITIKRYTRGQIVDSPQVKRTGTSLAWQLRTFNFNLHFSVATLQPQIFAKFKKKAVTYNVAYPLYNIEQYHINITYFIYNSIVRVSPGIGHIIFLLTPPSIWIEFTYICVFYNTEKLLPRIIKISNVI